MYTLRPPAMLGVRASWWGLLSSTPCWPGLCQVCELTSISLLSSANGKDPEESIQNPQAESRGKLHAQWGRPGYVGPQLGPEPRSLAEGATGVLGWGVGYPTEVIPPQGPFKISPGFRAGWL